MSDAAVGPHAGGPATEPPEGSAGPGGSSGVHGPLEASPPDAVGWSYLAAGSPRLRAVADEALRRRLHDLALDLRALEAGVQRVPAPAPDARRTAKLRLARHLARARVEILAALDSQDGSVASQAP